MLNNEPFRTRPKRGFLQPSPESKAQVERLAQRGYKPVSRELFRHESGGFIYVSTWAHDNQASLIMVDDGENVATFQRVSL